MRVSLRSVALSVALLLVAFPGEAGVTILPLGPTGWRPPPGAGPSSSFYRGTARTTARHLGDRQGERYLPLASGLMVMSYLGRVLDRSRRAS